MRGWGHSPPVVVRWHLVGRLQAPISTRREVSSGVVGVPASTRGNRRSDINIAQSPWRSRPSPCLDLLPQPLLSDQALIRKMDVFIELRKMGSPTRRQ